MFSVQLKQIKPHGMLFGGNAFSTVAKMMKSVLKLSFLLLCCNMEQAVCCWSAVFITRETLQYVSLFCFLTFILSIKTWNLHVLSFAFPFFLVIYALISTLWRCCLQKQTNGTFGVKRGGIKMTLNIHLKGFTNVGNGYLMKVNVYQFEV